jgi:hypothetical protein
VEIAGVPEGLLGETPLIAKAAKVRRELLARFQAADRLRMTTKPPQTKPLGKNSFPPIESG